MDEAAPYFDDSFEKLLTRVRQFKLGVVIAFQHLEQANEKLKSALASNTSIKYAGGVGYGDRRWLAHDMETTAEFIAAQTKDAAEPPKWTQFALYARNYTPKAIGITLPFGRLEAMPRMSEAAHQELLRRNQSRLASMKPREEASLAPEPTPAADATPAVEPTAKTDATPDAGEPSSSW